MLTYNVYKNILEEMMQERKLITLSKGYFPIMLQNLLDTFVFKNLKNLRPGTFAQSSTSIFAKITTFFDNLVI